MDEIPLWEQLKQMGFTPLTITNKYSRWDRFVQWLYYPKAEPLPLTTVYGDYLVNTIDGKYIEVSSHAMDFGYVDLYIDGKSVFSQRRFNNEDLLRLIPTEPIKITPKQRLSKHNFV
jgi:hypothetical protein